MPTKVTGLSPNDKFNIVSYAPGLVIVDGKHLGLATIHQTDLSIALIDTEGDGGVVDVITIDINKMRILKAHHTFEPFYGKVECYNQSKEHTEPCRYNIHLQTVVNIKYHEAGTGRLVLYKGHVVLLSTDTNREEVWKVHQNCTPASGQYGVVIATMKTGDPNVRLGQVFDRCDMSTLRHFSGSVIFN